jgi:hypothetical protein
MSGASVRKAAGIVALIAVGVLLAMDSTRALGVAIAVTGVLAVLLVSKPVSFVLVYVALRPLVDSAVHFQIGSWSLGTVWGAGLVIVLAVYWVTRGVRHSVHDLTWLIPIAYALAYAVFTLGRGGGDLTYALSNWVRIVTWALLAITCEQIASTAQGQRSIARAGTVMAVLTLAVIGLAIAQNQYGAAYYTSAYGQFDIVGQGPHGLASMAVLASAFVWMGAMRGPRRWPYVILASLLAVAVVLALVRTTFIAFALLTLWFLVWSLRGRRWGPVVAASLALAAAGAAVYSFQSLVVERLAELGSLFVGGSADLLAGSSRVGIWETVWHAATASPWSLVFGQGASGSLLATSVVFGEPLWSHNDFLEFLITGGVALLALYLMTIAWMFESGRKLALDQRQSAAVRETGRLVVVVVVAYVVMAFFNGMALAQSTLPIAMFIGLARGMSRTPGRTFLDGIGVDDPGARMLEGGPRPNATATDRPTLTLTQTR